MGTRATNFRGNISNNKSEIRDIVSKKGDKRGKGYKKMKVDSPEARLRAGLDLCSKRGNVMGAIRLYDLAQIEGVKLGQYHYAVLLYLCSSAAAGVVQPAKSGSASRSLSTADILSEGSENFGDFKRLGRRNSNRSELDITGESGNMHDKLETANDSESTVDVNESQLPNVYVDLHTLDELIKYLSGNDDPLNKKHKYGDQEDYGIEVGEDVKKYALQRGFEIYEKMSSEKIQMNEATLTSVARMAMALGNGDMAFDVVKQMKELGINPRLRSYGPALSVFCYNGEVDKAFIVEEHMLEHGVCPEEPELEALLRVSISAGRGEKVYSLLHKLRTSVRKVSPSTADLIEKWFKSKVASKVGKRKWDQKVVMEAVENGGGGWHGQGWLGKGKWTVSRTFVGPDGLCKCCGEKLVTIDLDPIETEKFAESVANVAKQREKNSNFEKFQKWLDYYGPFEAVVDGANVGLFSQRKFRPSKVNAIANGIRQMLPSKKWPLIVLHNRRIIGEKMDEPVNKALVDKWKNADALYATPTGSNDDWYWLYAAIKFKCLLVTNDEMRDHLFQLLGNDFFPKWKERHQESEKGHWHIPIASEHDSEEERTWLCFTRVKSLVARQDVAISHEGSRLPGSKKGHSRSDSQTKAEAELLPAKKNPTIGSTRQEISRNRRKTRLPSVLADHRSILPQIEAAEKFSNHTDLPSPHFCELRHESLASFGIKAVCSERPSLW
ncbi:hypothetical protein RJ639_032229 [Escallonia herrerae]|uniref:ribonuclease P n=1 Tax=Escallonia herrerae TaxID=1293975 RepID=A0AA88WUK3_9ASTE|nr:hypothetical protein RJ639_032229 [Escallonia herrerae]